MLDAMHGMMAGMGLGMIAGLVTATLWTAPSGDFLWGVILGSIAGLLIGVPVGKLGGHLGVLEGVMAGPMGGMMGAMLGQMIRPFDLDVFMPFFAFIVLLSLFAITYAARCGSRGKVESVEEGRSASAVFIGSWSSTALAVLLTSVLLSFPLDDAPVTSRTASDEEPIASLPRAFEAYNQAISGESRIEKGVQYASIAVSQARYTPNVLTVRKGIPLKLSITADRSAGCAREIVFPTLDMSRILPTGETVTLDIFPDKTGDLPFRCSMDMSRGKLVVVD